MKKIFFQVALTSLLAGCAGGPDLPAVLDVDPSEAALGDVPVETSASATFTIRNTGEADLEVYSTTFTAGDADVWRLQTEGGPIVAGGESMTLTVIFEPEDEEPATARVQVRSSDQATGPVTVTITATGTPSTVDGDEDGHSPAQGDCNDDRADVYPGAPELCDGRDNDCDGVTPAVEADADHDGERICEGDCDDADDDVYPGAPEICDHKDSDCSGGGDQDDADVDGDGLTICEGDCDDGEPLAYPGAVEVCGDDVDNDCSGGVDDIDVDLDGHSICHPAGDCDDDDPEAYPVIVDASAAGGGDGTEEAPFRGFGGAFGGLDATCRTIWVAGGDYTTSRSLVSGDTVTIIGEEGESVVISPPGTSTAQIFTVAAGASLTLRGVVLEGADVSVGDGGAVAVNGGVVAMHDVTVRDNECGGDGAGVSVAGSGVLTLHGGLFEGNVSGDDGGAISLASGTVTIEGTRFVGNEGALGGAVYAIGGVLDVDGATFDGNTAGEHGGAVYLEHGVSVELLRSVFWRNSAGGDGGALAAIDVDAADGEVRNNRFQNNVAGGDGGAVAVSGAEAVLVLANNTFTVNTAAGEGAHFAIDATDSTGVSCIANVGGWGDAGTGKAGLYAVAGAVCTHNISFFTSGTNFGGALADGVDGNLVQNPEFVAFADNTNPADDDLRLKRASPVSPGVDSGPDDVAWNDLDATRNDRGFEGGPHAAPLP